MKFSLNWLKEYIDIKETPEKLAEILTMHSFEVSGIFKSGEGLDKIVVGKVLEVKKHPNADKLKVCQVDIGSKKLTIICGASNIAKGQNVPVALVGAEFSNGLKIEKRELRGVESSGMICSAAELGLEEKSAGIMELDSNLKKGASLASVLGMKDTLLEIDILPNRAHDCLSYLGMAREIGVVTGRKIKLPTVKFRSSGNLKTEKFVNVSVKDKKLCARYCAQVMDGVQIAASPMWLQKKLQSVGVKSINNVVDITNFVLLETGQPMHAFDLEKINAGGKRNIIVRKAKKGEQIVALDKEKYELDENDLVIADSSKPIAVAGVIGGEETGVSEETKTLVLESANFDYKSIRKTSRRLNLNTESSDRFSKEIDEGLADVALSRAVSLIQELAGGKVAKKVDIYPVKSKAKNIAITTNEINKIAGVNLEEKKIISILKAFDFKVKKNGKKLAVEVPAVRKDLAIKEDLAEEILRVYGYENIKPVMPKAELGWFAGNHKKLDLENKVKNTLKGVGFTEVRNYSFIDKSLLNNDLLEISNPMQKEDKYMRDSLINGILKNIEYNLKFYPELKIYEIGKVFEKRDGNLPKEINMLCGAIVAAKKNQIFFAVKGIVELLAASLNLGNIKVKEGEYKVGHPRKTVEIKIGKEMVGVCAEIHPHILKELDIKNKIAVFDLNFDKLAELAKEDTQFKKIIKYPVVELDLAVVAPKKALWKDIKEIVFSVGGDLVKKVSLFDFYEGEKIGEDKKSLAFRITYQAEDRTLTSEEVKEMQDKIISVLEKKEMDIRK